MTEDATEARLQPLHELVGAMTWLLDDMADAGEARHPETGKLYDSVEHAMNALKKFNGGGDPAFDRYDMEELLESARDLHETDDVEIDGPLQKCDISPSDDGVWVRAWVWVHHEELKSLQGKHAGVECARCNEVISEESEGQSTPSGSMHNECAAEYELESPEDW